MRRFYIFSLLCLLTGLSLLSALAPNLCAGDRVRGEDVAEEPGSLKKAEEGKSPQEGALEKQLHEGTVLFTALQNDKERAAVLENWSPVTEVFQKLLDQHPTTGYAAASLFMLGRVRYSRYQQLHDVADLDQSIKDYADVVRLFPWHPLADDALLTLGRIQFEDKKNPQEAARHYARIITEYYNGDLGDKAVERMQFLAREHGTPAPPERTAMVADKNGAEAASGSSGAAAAQEDVLVSSAPPEKSDEESSATGAAEAPELPNVKKRTFVLPVKYWSSKNYTRIVINTSRKVSFREELLEKVGEQPRRLFIDFDKSYIEPKYRAPIPIKDGLLQQVRTAQFSPDTVRVVLDIESIESYKIYSLPDPFRVIVDVHGQRPPAPEVSVPEKQSGVGAEKEEQKAKKETPRGSEAPSLADAPATVKAPPATEEEKAEPVAEPTTEEPSTENNDQTTASAAPSSPSPERTADKPAEPPILILQDYKKVKFAASSKAPAPERNAPISPATAALSLAQQLNLGVRRIVLDPGHGGKDPGASAFGLQEKDIVLQVAKKLAVQLKKELGCEVILTRDDDSFISLEERTAIANTNGADLFISLHLNAHSSSKIYGFETYYLNLSADPEAIRVAALENATSTHQLSDLQGILSDIMKNSKIDESSRLARQVQEAVIDGFEGEKYQMKSMGVKQAPFYVLIGAEMPAILIEMAFISNKTDAMQMKKGRYQEMMAAELVQGIQKYIRTITASR